MERGLRNIRLNFSIFKILVIFVAFITDNLTSAQKVDVTPSDVILSEGDRTQLLCRYGEPIQYCRIQIPGEKVLNLSPDYSKTPGFTYYGDGLQAGQCGVTIERVSVSQHGQVKCSLGVAGDEIDGTINLSVALPPHRPEIDIVPHNRDNSFSTDKQLVANCTIRDGRPPANISWFLNDEPVTLGLGQTEIIELRSDNNVVLYTVRQEIHKHLSPEDNGKSLICRSEHIANKGEPLDAKVILNVQYRPLAQPDLKVYGLDLDRTAFINVTIQASPRPIIEWTVDGNVIPQGGQNERYAAYEPVDLGNGFYNVTLAIAGLTLEDTNRDYYFRASNSLGAQDYTVRISSSNRPPVGGLDIGAIVGIVVGAAVLLIVVLLIIFARATGRWCFAGKSPKSTANETSDTESADIKSTGQSKASKFTSLTAIFRSKNEKQKGDAQRDGGAGDSDVCEDEQRLAENGNESETREDASAEGENNDKKEEKQLVYAELVLKPSDDKPMPSKPSTEYAEIVYVQNPSPSGSEANKGNEK